MNGTSSSHDHTHVDFSEGGVDLNRELERFEREIIRKALEKAKGSNEGGLASR